MPSLSHSIVLWSAENHTSCAELQVPVRPIPCVALLEHLAQPSENYFDTERYHLFFLLDKGCRSYHVSLCGCFCPHWLFGSKSRHKIFQGSSIPGKDQ